MVSLDEIITKDIKMKLRYMGVYNVDYIESEDQEIATVLVPENQAPINTDTHCNYYEMESCMLTNDTMFDGVIGISNTAAVLVKMIDDETFKLWMS